LRGGLGKDILTGGGGPDHFDFDAIAESVIGPKRDVIRDFHDSQHDKIDLATIDANTGKPGNQPFVFIRQRYVRALPRPASGRDRHGALYPWRRAGQCERHLTADFAIAVHGSAPTALDFVL
jgi:hypothetical protein